MTSWRSVHPSIVVFCRLGHCAHKHAHTHKYLYVRVSHKLYFQQSKPANRHLLSCSNKKNLLDMCSVCSLYWTLNVIFLYWFGEKLIIDRMLFFLFVCLFKVRQRKATKHVLKKSKDWKETCFYKPHFNRSYLYQQPSVIKLSRRTNKWSDQDALPVFVCIVVTI